MIISSGKREEEEEVGLVGRSEDVPVVIVDEGEEEEIHGEDSEVIGAFSGKHTCLVPVHILHVRVHVHVPIYIHVHGKCHILNFV